MGKSYGQISIRERCEISRLQAEGLSIRQIAAALDRSPSSISREVRRNATRTRGYDPEEAQVRARARMWSGSRLDRDDDLRERVLAMLKRSWSPVISDSKLESLSSRTRVSIGSSIARSLARITSIGGSICHAASRSGGGAAARVAAQSSRLRNDAPWLSALPRSPIAKRRATGRPI